MALGAPKVAAVQIDHIGCDTKSVTYVETSIQNAAQVLPFARAATLQR